MQKRKELLLLKSAYYEKKRQAKGPKDLITLKMNCSDDYTEIEEDVNYIYKKFLENTKDDIYENCFRKISRDYFKEFREEFHYIGKFLINDNDNNDGGNNHDSI